MSVEARRAVLESTRWLTEGEVARLCGATLGRVRGWRKDGAVLCVRHGGRSLFPGYGFDPADGHLPLPGMRPVLATFGADRSAWSIACWFASANGFLGGRSPQDLLATEPGRVVEAARDEVAGVLHG